LALALAHTLTLSPHLIPQTPNPRDANALAACTVVLPANTRLVIIMSAELDEHLYSYSLPTAPCNARVLQPATSSSDYRGPPGLAPRVFDPPALVLG